MRKSKPLSTYSTSTRPIMYSSKQPTKLRPLKDAHVRRQCVMLNLTKIRRWSAENRFQSDAPGQSFWKTYPWTSVKTCVCIEQQVRRCSFASWRSTQTHSCNYAAVHFLRQGEQHPPKALGDVATTVVGKIRDEKLSVHNAIRCMPYWHQLRTLRRLEWEIPELLFKETCMEQLL